MRSFFQRGGWLLLAGLLFLGFLQPVQAAHCGCACTDGTIQDGGDVAGSCRAGLCDGSCRTACAAHQGVSSAECGEPTTLPPTAPGSGLCACSCGEELLFAASPGGVCTGGDASCTTVCATECTGHGAVTGMTCSTDDSSLPAPGSCVDRALTRPRLSETRRRQQEATVSRIERSTGGQPRSTWTCQSLPNDQIDNNRCVPLGCEGAPFCCLPGTGSAPVTTSESGTPGGEGTTAGTGSTEACAPLAVRRGTSQATVDAIAQQTGTDPSVWTCQRVCAREQRSNCVQHGCPETDDTSVLCCPPSIGIPPGQTCGGRGASGSGSGSAGGSGSGIGIARLLLPDCATTHDPRRAGKCQIADVFELGYAAVRFMFGLAGALLLVAFIVSGFKYLVNGYAGDVKTAKETMVNATFGIVIMLFAYIVVTFLYTSLTGNAPDSGGSGGSSTQQETTTTPTPRSSSNSTPTPPAGGTASGGATGGGISGGTASGPSGTCRCEPSGLSAALTGAVPEDQINLAESMCRGARPGTTFDRSALRCTGPTTESECRLLEGEINRRVPIITVGCTWSR